MTSETVLNDAPVHLETGFDYDDLGFGDWVPDGDLLPTFGNLQRFYPIAMRLIVGTIVWDFNRERQKSYPWACEPVRSHA